MENFEKYKRQISLWGLEHQEILMNSSICLLGSNLIVLEITKGLVLSGIRNLTIVDNELVNSLDLKYYIFCTDLINDYKCKAIKRNLINLNKNANINYIIESPIDYFHRVILKNDFYDIIICNLSVKNNLTIERLCIENNKNIITCHSNGFLGYLNICVKNHLYMSNDRTDELSFYNYLSISLHNELKKYVKNIEFAFFQANTPSNKVLFFVKCYEDFYQLKDKKISFFEFIKKKIELTELNFNINKQYNPIDLNKIVSRVNYLLKNKKSIKKNQLYLFLIVYKSFIKKKKNLPYLFDFNFNDQYINTILKERNILDKKEVEYLINKKRKKYNFKKLFNISYFIHFFSNFHLIKKNKNNENKNHIYDNFLDFVCLYSFSSSSKQVYENNIEILKKEKHFSNASEEEKYISSKMFLRKKSKTLLCNRKCDILNINEKFLFKNLKKKGNAKSYQEIYHLPFLFNKNDKSLLRLCSYIDININVLLKKIEKMNSIFINHYQHINFNTDCVFLLLSGFITQEVIKICSLFLKPHLNYLFFKQYA